MTGFQTKVVLYGLAYLATTGAVFAAAGWVLEKWTPSLLIGCSLGAMVGVSVVALADWRRG